MCVLQEVEAPRARRTLTLFHDGVQRVATGCSLPRLSCPLAGLESLASRNAAQLSQRVVRLRALSRSYRRCGTVLDGSAPLNLQSGKRKTKTAARKDKKQSGEREGVSTPHSFGVEPEGMSTLPISTTCGHLSLK